MRNLNQISAPTRNSNLNMVIDRVERNLVKAAKYRNVNDELFTFYVQANGDFSEVYSIIITELKNRIPEIMETIYPTPVVDDSDNPANWIQL